MFNTSLFYDTFQYLSVGALVAGCAIYCILALAPSAMKKPLRHTLLRLPLLGRILNEQSQVRADGSCGSGCGGCSPPQITDKKIHWHPRQR